MAQVTPNMQLTVWNNSNDRYDHNQLADNFVKIDLHDHDGSKGVQLDGAQAIKPDSISSVQIGGNAVGSAELQSLAVNSNHIQDNAVTSDKIAVGAVTETQLSNSALIPPFVPHTNTEGSLPTVTNKGTALYDGYTIDYGFDLNIVTTSPDTLTATFDTGATNKTFIWRLRYNDADASWDFIGGTPIILQSASDATSTGGGPTAGSWYTGWGGRDFAKIRLPFKGAYNVTAGGLGDIAAGTATFRSGLAIGPTTSTLPGLSSLVTNAVSSSYTGAASGVENDAVDSTVTNAFVTINDDDATGANSNWLNLVFGYGTKTSPSAQGILRMQKMIIYPFRNLQNFS